MMQVAPITTTALISPKLAKARQLERTMAELWAAPTSSSIRRSRSTTRRAKKNVHGVVQRPCTGCGKCCTGCPEGAKNTLDYNYLALAERFGARCARSARSSTWRYGPNAASCCRSSITCAGTEQSSRRPISSSARGRCTPRASCSAREARSGTRPGRWSVPAISGGDALGIVYDTKTAQYPTYGPTITTTTVHWHSVCHRASSSSRTVATEPSWIASSACCARRCGSAEIAS